MASSEHRQAVKQGATPDRDQRDVTQSSDDTAIAGVGGTGGSSGAGSVRSTDDDRIGDSAATDKDEATMNIAGAAEAVQAQESADARREAKNDNKDETSPKDN